MFLFSKYFLFNIRKKGVHCEKWKCEKQGKNRRLMGIERTKARFLAAVSKVGAHLKLMMG